MSKSAVANPVVEITVATENAESLIASPIDSYIDETFIVIVAIEKAIIPKNAHNSSLFIALKILPVMIR